MTLLHFTTAINASPQTIFDRIADFANYDQWLPSSNMYKSVMSVSDNPVRLGSTYVDQGTNSTMNGRVTVYESPRKITFHQVTHLKLLMIIPAGLAVTIAYQLEPNGSSTTVVRDVTVQASGLMSLMQSMLLPRITAESQRILTALKTGLEKSS